MAMGKEADNFMEDRLFSKAGGQGVWTVSGITERIKGVLQTRFSDVCVEGEVSQFTRARSGHVYMTLKDENAVLKAIIWRSMASRLKFDLEEGLEVVARGSVDVYPPRGSYQLLVRDIQPRGLGALQLAFRQLLEKLEEEGLFRDDRKKPLPRFPEKIGIITSPTGAAIRDMVRIISRRWPLSNLYLLPRRVQGEGAAEEIAGGIYLLNRERPDFDVLIVGRGGGSLEDLWAFNEEIVARAIFDSEIPVISAVGHEIDFSVSDFVADYRAATPTEAGEQVVPDMMEMIQRLQYYQKRSSSLIKSHLSRARQRLDAAAKSHMFRHPEGLIQDRMQRIDELMERMKSRFEHDISLRSEKLHGLGGKLDALGPMSVIKRGYSVILDEEGQIVRCVADVAPKDRIRCVVSDGEFKAEVS